MAFCLGLRGLLGGGLTDLETDRLELARQLLHVLLAEVVLDGERLELDGLDVTALLALLDERTSLLAFQKFLKLMLCQSGSLRPFNCRGNLLNSKRPVGPPTF